MNEEKIREEVLKETKRDCMIRNYDWSIEAIDLAIQKTRKAMLEEAIKKISSLFVISSKKVMTNSDLEKLGIDTRMNVTTQIMPTKEKIIEELQKLKQQEEKP